jgi:hypothetical protein
MIVGRIETLEGRRNSVRLDRDGSPSAVVFDASSAFDFIAIPKGQCPGGPVQSSTGDWYNVIYHLDTIKNGVKRLVFSARQHRRVRVHQIDDAIAELQRLRDEIEPLEDEVFNAEAERAMSVIGASPAKR